MTTKSLAQHHGEARRGASTPEYEAWRGMKQRCRDTRPNMARYYRDKGITVCDEWVNDYLAFLAHIGRMPSRGFTLDRIDNARGYEPGNVRWVTKSEQHRNQSSNRLVTFNGVTQCRGDWAKDLGISHDTLRSRLDRLGWPVEKALTAPALSSHESAVARTQCLRGHELTEANTYYYAPTNVRQCRTCNAERERRRVRNR